ncbi:unnamed protein product, partial [Mesorhabditis spiculigera]
MTRIKIRLVGGPEDHLFKPIEVDNQILYTDLKKKIESLICIPKDFQQLQFRGEDLPVVLRPIQTIRFGEELVVKHALLGTWSAYLEYCKSASDTKNPRLARTKFAHQAIACSKALQNSGFFVAYVAFFAQWSDTMGQMLRFDQHDLKQSATTFFSKMHPNCKIDFKEKEATKEVKNFKELHNIEDFSLQKKVVVETYLLSLILGIRDLNEENIGSTEEKALSIVDFYVPAAANFLHRRIVDDFKCKNLFGGTFGGMGKADEILTEIAHDERMKIAKDALPHWNRITTMTSDIIGMEESELREHGIKFWTSASDVEDYLQDIKSNYASICSAFQ